MKRINVRQGCPPDVVRDAMRALLADLRRYEGVRD